METRSLASFIKGAKDQLTKRVKKMLAPAYDPKEKTSLIKKIEKSCQGLGKTPFPAQQDIINALVNGYYAQRKKALFLTAEMGCGKTLMGIIVAHALAAVKGRAFRTLIICPPTLLSTWKEEIEDIYGKGGANIINLNAPNALRILMQCRAKHKIRPSKPTFFISGWNRMKTGYKWQPVDWSQLENSRGYTCLRCGHVLDDLIGSKKRLRCPECKEPLWKPVPGDKNKKYAPVLFIKKYLKGYFDFLLVDEVHQLKGEDTIQGAMLGQLAGVCGHTLCLTGTLSGGKASDIFYLLQRTIALNYSKDERKLILPEYGKKKEFCDLYGTVEEILKEREDHKSTGRNYSRTVQIKEKPGISPLVIKQFFIENSAFLRLSDIADALPPFREEIEFCDLPEDLHRVYKDFEQELTREAKEAMKEGDMTVLGRMLSSLLAWPDFPQRECNVENKVGDVVAYAPAFPIDKTPKDERLIELIKQARSKGRKCLVFVEYTGTWGGDIHVAEILKANGIKPLVMKSTTVQASKRLGWIRRQMKRENYDCLICQPKLVEVGLNLREFPEVIFYQTGYSIYVLRQASRRSYRPGQKQEVVVRYLINRDTAQEKAMTLIASKLEASLVLEGELSDKGLVALSEVGDNMAVELARSLVGEIKLNSLEAQFASYKQVELEVDSVIDDEAPVEIETETVTTITKGDRKAVINVRKKAVLVGSLQERPNGSLVGKLFRCKAIFQDGQVFVGGKCVGTYDQNKIVFFKQPDREFRLKKANTLPGLGMAEWKVVELKVA